MPLGTYKDDESSNVNKKKMYCWIAPSLAMHCHAVLPSLPCLRTSPASPFVLQTSYGISPQLFSVIFGTNALGLMTAGQINGRLVGRVSPRRLLTVGLVATATGGVALLSVVAIGGTGLVGVLPPLFVIVSSIGFVLPNATALALSDHPHTAGSASALIGVLQFSIGAAAAPLVGVAGSRTTLPMAIIIASLGLSALAAFMLSGRSRSEGRQA